MKATAHKGTTAKHAGTNKHTQGKGKHHPAKQKKAATHHHAAKKQTAHTAAKTHTAAKPKKLAQADAPVRAVTLRFPADGRVDGAAAWDELADVACCPVLALAESLRLSGRVCGADDVLALYGRLTNDADAGATIVATLEAACEYGLAGVRPVSFRVARPDDWAVILGVELPGPHAVLAETGRWWSWSQPWPPAAFPDAVIEEAWAVVWP